MKFDTNLRALGNLIYYTKSAELKLFTKFIIKSFYNN